MNIRNISPFLPIFTQIYIYILPQNSKLRTYLASHYSSFILLSYEFSLCKSLSQCIDKYEHYTYFPISHEFYIHLTILLQCRCRGFCHRTESDLFLFLQWQILELFIFVSWYLYLDYELPLCNISNQCIIKYWFYKDFPISRGICSAGTSICWSLLR